MTTELLANLWRINQLAAGGSIQQLTPDTYRNRLTPGTASAAFIALHTIESMHNFAKIIFGHEVTIERKTGRGATDNGQPVDLPAVQQMAVDAFAMIADHVARTSPAQWAEVISTPFGDTPRMGALAFLMHHNSYHAGQIVQAVKKGKVFGGVSE